MQDKREFEQLTDEKRWKLHGLRRQGYSMRKCGRRLGVNVSTISRKLGDKSADVAGGPVYLPDHAILITKGRRARCHPRIKMNDPIFRKMIIIEIQKGRSPPSTRSSLTTCSGTTPNDRTSRSRFNLRSSVSLLHYQRRSAKCGGPVQKLNEIADDINNTPMKCLDFQTPNEVYSPCCIQN